MTVPVPSIPSAPIPLFQGLRRLAGLSQVSGISGARGRFTRLKGIDARVLAEYRPRSITPAQWLAVACLLHAAALGVAWWHVSSRMLLNDEAGRRALAFGRLAGLLVGSGVLLQLVLVSRLPWLEPSLGCDRLYRWHRRLGFAIGSLFLAHPVLVTVGYARRHQLSVSRQFMEFAADWPTRLAIAALVVIALIVASSTPLIRRRLTYETWHVSHLAMYVALGLASWHQANGAEFAGQPWWADYWIALHMAVIGGLVVFRAGRPIVRCARHRFRIDRIVSESDDVTSVYLTGRQIDRFTYCPGQYANVVFLSKGRWSPHPFSFSAAPNGQFLRVSIKAAGDFTNRVRELTPGTLALLEGPLGAFTAAEPRDKYLMVAGGIGITPIRALIESLAAAGRDIVLLYSVKTANDLVFASELRALTAQCHFILSRDTENPESTETGETTVGYEHGRIDLRMLARLVPDVQDREVFICGPQPMMKAVAATLGALQVRESSIHYEQFA
jgi:predicted ferric reductase